ncbi:MAG TPA: glycosyltransferase [Streptosporangiaceae bacterium]|nr:glycosyltransferase [Streptosporangiaceae bacterium]
MRPADLGLRPGAGLPGGMAVDLDADTRQLTGDVLFGGSPARAVRLSPAGRAALEELRGGAVVSAAGAVLAARLADTGLAHPRPGPATAALDVTVVVPVRDRAAELDRCLAAAGSQYPVLVVDDGSADPAAVAAVCAARGARLARRPASGGPGPARNTALAQVSTEFVAFLDSDCVPPPGWIAGLAGHFADPLVAAAAPRIVALRAAGSPGDPGAAGGTSGSLGPDDPDAAGGGRGDPGTASGDGGSGDPGAAGMLDLGDRPARVAPLTRVSYVPTAALVVRRAVIGEGFDETLRYGEDVDLVWRLTGVGWRVRYDPSVQVAHADPAGRGALLARRFRYGNSAAPLARRHPGALTPLILQPWPALTMAALLARRPVLAGAAFGASTALLARRLRANGLPAQGLARPMAGGVWQTWLGTGRWCGQFAAPAVLAVLARPGGRRARTRWGRRLAAVSLLAGPPLAQWARDRRAAGQSTGTGSGQALGHGRGPGPDPGTSPGSGPGPGSSPAPGPGSGPGPDPGPGPGPGLDPGPGPGPGPGRGSGPGPGRGQGSGPGASPGGRLARDVLGALRQIAETLAEQAAYGAGVYAGCLREQTLAPVLPTVSRKPFEGLRSRRETG